MAHLRPPSFIALAQPDLTLAEDPLPPDAEERSWTEQQLADQMEKHGRVFVNVEGREHDSLSRCPICKTLDGGACDPYARAFRAWYRLKIPPRVIADVEPVPEEQAKGPVRTIGD